MCVEGLEQVIQEQTAGDSPVQLKLPSGGRVVTGEVLGHIGQEKEALQLEVADKGADFQGDIGASGGGEDI